MTAKKSTPNPAGSNPHMSAQQAAALMAKINALKAFADAMESGDEALLRSMWAANPDMFDRVETIGLLVNGAGKSVPGATIGGLGLLALEVVLAGIERKVDFKARIGKLQNTVLMGAAASNNFEIVNVLLPVSDPLAKNVEGRTAAGYARWSGNNEMADYLEAAEIAHSFKFTGNKK